MVMMLHLSISRASGWTLRRTGLGYDVEALTSTFEGFSIGFPFFPDGTRPELIV